MRHPARLAATEGQGLEKYVTSVYTSKCLKNQHN